MTILFEEGFGQKPSMLHEWWMENDLMFGKKIPFC